MLSPARDRLPYSAWVASLAVHTLIVGAAALVSTQVAPVIKEEIFR